MSTDVINITVSGIYNNAEISYRWQSRPICEASQLTAQNRNKDLHLFTSNIIFPRVASVDICNDPPKVDIGNLSAENVLLSPDSVKRERLKYSYCVLLARILCTFPAFQHLRKLLPDHIPHEYTRKMSAAPKVYPLPIMFKNEAKHDEWLAITDGYEMPKRSPHGPGAPPPSHFLWTQCFPLESQSLTE